MSRRLPAGGDLLRYWPRRRVEVGASVAQAQSSAAMSMSQVMDTLRAGMAQIALANRKDMRDRKAIMEKVGSRIDGIQALTETALGEIAQTVERHEGPPVPHGDTIRRMEAQLAQHEVRIKQFRQEIVAPRRAQTKATSSVEEVRRDRMHTCRRCRARALRGTSYRTPRRFRRTCRACSPCRP